MITGEAVEKEGSVIEHVAGPDDLVLVEVGDQLGDDEAGRDVAANDLRGLLHKRRQELRRPEPVAE